MKILQIHNFHFVKGGAEKIYLETGRLFEEKGHKVIYFSTKNDKNEPYEFEEYFVDNVNFFNLSSFKKFLNVWDFFYSKSARVKLEELIVKERPEIAHLHIFSGRLTSAILPVLKKHNIPVVMSVHEYRMLCPVYTCLDSQGRICEKCAGRNYYYCILKRCNRNNVVYSSVSAIECYFRDFFIPWGKYIEKFIMVSKFILKKHLQYKPHLKNKVVQIYNFIDLKKYKPEHSHNGYYLYFGRLSREKGLLTLLNAWKEFPEIKLKIVGTGVIESKLREFVKKNHLENVEFLGVKKGNELIDIIKNAKFVLLPSEWYENNPLSIIESLSLGKPVIGADIGGIPELIKDGFNGFLFKSGDVDSLRDAIKKAEAINFKEYTVFSKNARGLCEKNFSKEKFYKKLKALYLTLLGKTI